MPHPAELKQQIDELALRLVMGDPSEAEASICIGALESIRDSATRGRAPAVAAAAVALLSALPDAASPANALSEGIAALQRALEEADDAASHYNSPAHDPELLTDFIVESRDHLVNIEAQVLTLERDPGDSEALNSTLRGFHTIKGLAGFLELWEVQKLAHEVEAVLDRARNGELTIDSEAIDVILAGADHLKHWLTHVQSKLQGQTSSAPESDDELLSRIARLLASTAEADFPALTPPPDRSPDSGPEPLNEAPDTTAAPAEARAAAAPTMRRSEAMAVKVDTRKLDYLVDMAGEMVIAESLVRHDGELSAIKSPLLQRKIAHLTRITAELQKTAMAMRLVPIGPLFRRMARLVRDLSHQFGKRVEMETRGEDIELDRTIVEELADPLMHMVRNAMDHGIELPAERVAAGKTPEARVLLKATHQAGQVVIEVNDDGRGLDRDKILARGIQRGLISSGEGMSDSDVYNLIFEPGFSTAAQVTSVSGRGVGMDVVRRHIEKLRGRIEIRSVLGQGATFMLKLPLTLAIIDGLVVGVGQERYIVPLFAVRELFRPTADTVWTVQGRAEMALVRGSLLPVARLYRVFAVQPKSEDPLMGVLIVAEVEGRRFCVLVDELIGKQEVVIKSLGEMFKNAPGVAGGAILGDGRVGLVLDLDRLYKERASATELDRAAFDPGQSLAPAEFEQIRQLAHRTFGLDLKHGKEELVSARLRRLLRSGGHRSFHAYYRSIVEDKTGESLIAMIDALATNHTSFLREPDHFDFLRRQVLPNLSRRDTLEIWSAACATGEEVWSLAMVLREAAPPCGVRLWASDVSSKALAFAEGATYPKERCHGIPPQWLARYFLPGNERTTYSVIPALRAQARFRRLNLVQSFSWPRQFPVIFCRNVMIYFDRQTQEALVGRLAECLEPGGYLFVGHAESLTGVTHALQYVKPAVYRKPGIEARCSR